MGIKKNIFLCTSLFLAIFFLQNCSCGKTLGFDCAEVKYSFSAFIKAYPDSDSINIGDTLWLEVDESVSFKDNFNNFIDYSGAENLGSVVDIQRIDEINKSFIESVNDFDYKLITGLQIKKSMLYIEYGFAENNKRYKFKLGIIPRIKGIYRIGVGSASNVYRKNDKCTKAAFSINFKETRSHDYYIRLVNPDAPIDIPITNNYFFKVK